MPQTNKAEGTEKNVAVSAPPVGYDEELVPIELFKDNDKYSSDVFVSVNGERVQIRRGERVMVKRKFARVLEQSAYQDKKTADLISRKSGEYAAQERALNI